MKTVCGEPALSIHGQKLDPICLRGNASHFTYAHVNAVITRCEIRDLSHAMRKEKKRKRKMTCRQARGNRAMGTFDKGQSDKRGTEKMRSFSHAPTACVLEGC